MTHFPFVVVSHSGLPTGFTTLDDALTQFMRNTFGTFLVKSAMEERGPAIREAVIKDGGYRHWQHESCNMGETRQCGAIFHTHPHEFPEDFRNRHFPPSGTPLGGRSTDYIVEAEAAWAKREGPRVGDYILHPDLTRTRFTHDWGDGIQAGGGNGSYCIGKQGYLSYSGGLSKAIPKDKIEYAGYEAFAEVWFFRDGHVGAHRGIPATITARVYKELP